MNARIALLTTPELAPSAAAALRPFPCLPVFDEGQLRAALTPPVRLVAFASGTLVPADVLAALPGPAYNVHPGPPEYPGLFPSVFALYGGAAWFGITVHEMTADLDAGPIVAADRFAIPATADRLALDTLTLKRMLELLARLAPQLADPTARLPLSPESWSGTARRKCDFEDLCRLPADVSAAELARRYRAVGEGPHHALEIEIHGNRFKLDNRRGGDVVRAGQPRQPASDAAKARIISK